MSSSPADLLAALSGPGACLAVATPTGTTTRLTGHRQTFTTTTAPRPPTTARAPSTVPDPTTAPTDDPLATPLPATADLAAPLPTTAPTDGPLAAPLPATADLAAPLPMTADTVHDLGSVTKIVATTASLMSLVDAGAVRLDRPASHYASHLVDSTLTDLLRHRAGLWEWWPTYLTATSPTEALRVVADLPLRYPPDAGHHYSDLGFMTLGSVVETVAGKPLATAARSLVFAPLHLPSVRYGSALPDAPVAAGAPGDVVERHMITTGTPYPVTVPPTPPFDGWRTRVRVGEVDDGNAYHAFGGVAGHAGLFGTAADLVTFGRALLDSLRGDGHWSAATTRTFLTPGVDPGQALGFRLWHTPSGPAYGHTGFPGVAFAVLPALDATVVLLTNRLHVTTPPPPAPYEPGWLRILDAVHGDLVERGSS